MKHNIATLAVWDAFRQDAECPLCVLERKQEHQLITSHLENIMDPATRTLIEERGYCGHHLRLLYERNDLLPLAIQLKDILAYRVGRRRKRYDEVRRHVERVPRLIRILRNRSQIEDETCLICDELEEGTSLNIHIVFTLWKKEEDFREAVTRCMGFCIPHEDLLLREAPLLLGGKHLSSFLSTVTTRQEDRFRALEEALSYFIDQYDYRNANRPWGTSREAVPRAIETLAGMVLNEKKEK
ncbi:hypothetical protein Spith_2015 [Spirochaeta thermophila DSM 6578]|uniref:Uncharacterized protein n=1 Tax=Winmispira thermophila (strain ATCC 700085 / DSM 6578 / Z-1203) TaxID=869211 RepID=G0GED6_WINT7|nr:DUF6062 family protein [Spirochaeta thermophila]AEJ62273.1 hypothetical protein Spith_2015 [Spirochaeta thermophila DSM 6578]